jgi:hypothetical protein
MLVFQRTQDEGSVFSEFYAEVIGNYLSTADDILFHIYVKTLRVKRRSPMIESSSLESHNSVETCIHDDQNNSIPEKLCLEKNKTTRWSRSEQYQASDVFGVTIIQYCNLSKNE